MPVYTTQQPGRTIVIDGTEHLFFSGYAYLGMNGLPAFRELVAEGLEKYGLSFPSSRISNTRLMLFDTFEQLLSRMTGREATVCFASGFLAGSVLTHPWRNHIMAAPGTHPALYKGPAIAGSFAGWVQEAQEKIQHAATAFVLLADAVNIFAPAVNDFSFLQQSVKPVNLIVDDSHGIGLIGQNGEGISSRLPAAGHKITISYSLSKAFNLIGGAVSCDAATAAWLRSTPEYTAATSLSPAYMHAFIEGQELYAMQREKLRRNTRLFRELVQSLPGMRYSDELPVFVLPRALDETKLLQQGIVLSSFAYPDPNGEKIQRIIVNALHTEEDLHYLAGVLQKEWHTL